MNARTYAETIVERRPVQGRAGTPRGKQGVRPFHLHTSIEGNAMPLFVVTIAEAPCYDYAVRAVDSVEAVQKALDEHARAPVPARYNGSLEVVDVDEEHDGD